MTAPNFFDESAREEWNSSQGIERVSPSTHWIFAILIQTLSIYRLAQLILLYLLGLTRGRSILHAN